MGNAIIHKYDGEGNFTKVPNEIIRLSLPLEALALYCFIESMPEGWRFSEKSVMEAYNANSDLTGYSLTIGKVKKGIRALEDAGLLKRTRTHRDGKLSGIVWEVFSTCRQNPESPLRDADVMATAKRARCKQANDTLDGTHRTIDYVVAELRHENHIQANRPANNKERIKGEERTQTRTNERTGAREARPGYAASSSEATTKAGSSLCGGYYPPSERPWGPEPVAQAGTASPSGYGAAPQPAFASAGGPSETFAEMCERRRREQAAEEERRRNAPFEGLKRAVASRLRSNRPLPSGVDAEDCDFDREVFDLWESCKGSFFRQTSKAVVDEPFQFLTCLPSLKAMVANGKVGEFVANSIDFVTGRRKSKRLISYGINDFAAALAV